MLNNSLDQIFLDIETYSKINKYALLEDRVTEKLSAQLASYKLKLTIMNNYIQSRNPMSIIKTIAKDSKASDKEFIINYCEKHKNDNSKNQSEGDD